jgi:hypothetical protein
MIEEAVLTFVARMQYGEKEGPTDWHNMTLIRSGGTKKGWMNWRHNA